ncbi:MAG: MFS transporter [Candidatus Hermodarchaeota archaeon]
MNQNIHKNPTTYSKWLEFTIFLLFFLGPLTGNIINVLFGVLSSYFQVTPDNILIAIPAFMFPFAIIQLFSGAISDVKGRIPVLIIGLILFGIAMLIAATSFNLVLYIIANVIGGIGFGFINPVLIALMTDISPPQNIGKKMGYLGASANLGVGLGPLIASQMILIGWQSIYIVFIGITFFCLIYFVSVKRPPQNISEESGIRSFLSQLSEEWRRLTVILMIISAFLISHTYIAINIWTSKTLSQAHVLNETIIGAILGLAGVGAAITGVLTGHLIKRKSAKFPLLIGLLILLSSIGILLIIGDITNPDRFILLAIGWILAGFSGGILFTSITFYSQVLSPKRRGALAGSLTASYFTGIALVPITLAPFSDNWGITGVYIAILIASIFFIIITVLLYIYSKSVIVERNKIVSD